LAFRGKLGVNLSHLPNLPHHPNRPIIIHISQFGPYMHELAWDSYTCMYRESQRVHVFEFPIWNRTQIQPGPHGRWCHLEASGKVDSSSTWQPCQWRRKTLYAQQEDKEKKLKGPFGTASWATSRVASWLQ
jgi:hypothetical protein